MIAGKFACTAFSHKAQSFLPTTKFGYRYPAILRNSTRRACFLNSSQTRETIPYDSPTINLEETSRRRFLERMTSRVAKYKSSVVYEGKFSDLQSFATTKLSDAQLTKEEELALCATTYWHPFQMQSSSKYRLAPHINSLTNWVTIDNTSSVLAVWNWRKFINKINNTIIDISTAVGKICIRNNLKDIILLAYTQKKYILHLKFIILFIWLMCND